MNRWLVFWYDGDASRASIVDFGTNPCKDPYGNEDSVKQALGSDVGINGMVRLPSDDDSEPDIIIDDQDVILPDVVFIR